MKRLGLISQRGIVMSRDNGSIRNVVTGLVMFNRDIASIIKVGVRGMASGLVNESYICRSGV